MKDSNHRRVRIKDIADLAGVSVGTVDRVIHNRGEVSETTRKKILTIVKKLNFEPDVLASTLASKRTIKIAVLLPSIASDTSFWKSPVEGIEMAREEIARYNINIEYHLFDQFDKKSFKKNADYLLKSDPDAAIIAPFFKDCTLELIDSLNYRNIPFLFINSNIEAQKNITYIGQDSYQSGVVAGKLMGMALQMNDPVLIVNISRELRNHRHIVRRNAGFEEYFRLNIHDNRTIEYVNIESNEEKDIFEELETMIKKVSPGGIFVSNSRVFMVAKYLKKNNIKNVYLIGFDLIDNNISYLEEGIIDILISQKPVEQGYKSVISLFNYMVLHKELPKEQHLPIDIIMRENIKYYLNN